MFGHGSFSFKDLDRNNTLFILIGGEYLRFFITPPTVSIPKDKGVASIITIPSVYSDSSPQIIPP